MGFSVLTQPNIEDNILRDILNQLPNANVGVDSDYGIRAAATASAIEGLYQDIAWTVRQIFPDTADADIMAVHANLRGVTRKAGTVATGTIAFTGVAGSTIPLNVQLKNTAGLVFYTTSAGTIDGAGNATIAAQALGVGVRYNQSAGALLTLLESPTGVNAQATVVTMLAGTDAETDASLLARLLNVLRDPPASGNVADYQRWALEVDGCDGAYVYPLRRGLGTTDVIITSAGGLPSLALIDAVKANIDAKRPCGVNTTYVYAPSVITQNHDIQVRLSGVTLADATVKINAALVNYYANLTPGSPYIKSVVEALISDVAGVVDRWLVAPSTNVVPIADEGAVQWCRLGTVTVSAMP